MARRIPAALAAAALLAATPAAAQPVIFNLFSDADAGQGWNGTLHCDAQGHLAIVVTPTLPIAIPGLSNTISGALTCDLHATLDVTIGSGFVSSRRPARRHSHHGRN
jgi:hypothetical protein